MTTDTDELIERDCTCFEVAGEDQNCVEHGFTLERAAAWTDDEADLLDAFNTTLSARVIRKKAREAATLIAQQKARIAELEEAVRTDARRLKMLVEKLALHDLPDLRAIVLKWSEQTDATLERNPHG